MQYSKILGPMPCDQDLLGPMEMLFSWSSNRQIADETCEMFYKCNTFLVHCEDLPIFLGAKVHKTLPFDVSGLLPAQEPTYIRPFETKDWVTSISVIIGMDNTRYSRYLSHELRYLLECPRLRKLTIKTGWATLISCRKEWTGVLKELQLKIGDGLEAINANPIWASFGLMVRR